MKYNHRTQKHKKNKPRRSTTRRKGGSNTQVQTVQTTQQGPSTKHFVLRNTSQPNAPAPAPVVSTNTPASRAVAAAKSRAIATSALLPPLPEQQEQQEQPQIQPPDAPTLDKLKQTVSEYTYSYLKGVLRTIADGDLHRRYTDATETDTIFVFVLSEIINTLDAEIAELMDTYSSGTYTFGPNDRDRVVQELEAYKRYFQTYQLQPPEVDRVNLDYHEALFH